MTVLLPYRDLAVALAIGLLIGIERGWQLRGAVDGSRVAGLRTFGLLGLLGGLAALLGARQPLLGGALAAGAVVMMVLDYRRADAASRNVSATTEVAALLAFGLGALAVSGFAVLAVAAAAVVTLLLAQRRRLHDMLRGMTEADIKAVARFAVIAGVVWPLLPDRAIGPYAAWNPRDLWLVVVVVCGLSFAGYAAGGVSVRRAARWRQRRSARCIRQPRLPRRWRSGCEVSRSRRGCCAPALPWHRR